MGAISLLLLGLVNNDDLLDLLFYLNQHLLLKLHLWFGLLFDSLFLLLLLPNDHFGIIIIFLLLLFLIPLTLTILPLPHLAHMPHINIAIGVNR